MRPVADILHPRNRAILADFAASNRLLAFDSMERWRRWRQHRPSSDASLNPPTAYRHRPPLPVRRDFRSDLDDVTRRLDGIPVRYIFGNFGSRARPHGHCPLAVILEWARHLVAHLQPTRGLVVEEKRYSVTVHYRHARNKRWALRTIAQAVSELTDARVVEGNQTVTLLPPNGPDKGIALQQARGHYGRSGKTLSARRRVPAAVPVA